MVNQVACVEFPGRSHFRTNSSESHLFGLEPNYGCCTANMHQGWPKLALHAVQQIDRALCIAHLLPVSVRMEDRGCWLSLWIETDYPFRTSAKITVDANGYGCGILIRVPAGAKEIRVNGELCRPRRGHIRIAGYWTEPRTYLLEWKAAPHFVRRPTGLQTVEYGPLVFALPVGTEYRMREYTRNGVERKFPYCDYELIPKTAWNYGFAGHVLTVEERPVDDVPFSSVRPAVAIRTRLASVDWPWEDGFDTVPAVKPASSTPCGESTEMELVPYGCAKLRMTEMPQLKRNKE
jgi:hypothetical protein